MFDLGFGELLLIAVVALIVLGPERLPQAARFAGLWVRRARAQWHSVRAELERELEAEELKRSLHDTQAALKQAQLRLQDEVGQAQQQLQDEVGQVQEHLQDPPVTMAQPLDALDAPPADATPANLGGTPPAGTDDEPERR